MHGKLNEMICLKLCNFWGLKNPLGRIPHKGGGPTLKKTETELRLPTSDDIFLSNEWLPLIKITSYGLSVEPMPAVSVPIFVFHQPYVFALGEKTTTIFSTLRGQLKCKLYCVGLTKYLGRFYWIVLVSIIPCHTK